MISKIVPLKRFPKHLNIFDYTVPPEMEQDIAVGQLVSIPLRTSTIFGLVFEIEDSTNTELKEIESIVHIEPLVTKHYLELHQTLSQLYGISLGTMINMGMLPLQKRKLKKIELLPFSEINNSQFSSEYYYYSTKKDHAQLYASLEHESCAVIIVPEIHHIDELYSFIPEKLKSKTTTWTSNLSTKEKFERWLQIRNQEKSIIIGTRSALLLPYPHLSRIIIDYEHDENMKHWDQAPRFHGKDVARLYAKKFGAKLTYASFSPSFESYYDITKQDLAISGLKRDDKKLLFTAEKSTNVHIVNIQTERINQNYKIFSESVQEAIRKTKGNIYISLNRKGYATSVGCNDCGHVETDPDTDLPLVYSEQTKTLQSPYSSYHKALRKQCPKCNSTLVRMIGIGTELVEKYLYNIFGQNLRHQIIRIDKNQDDISFDAEKPHIIIGTSMAGKYVNWKKTDIIVSLDVDRQLAIPEYTATEQVWHDIQEILYRKNASSTFFIQTVRPDHTLFISLNEKDRIYRTELQKRKKLGYPPYIYLTRYFFGATSATQAQSQCDILVKAQRMQLTKHDRKAIISNPYEMHPRYFRSQYWYSCIAKVDHETWLEDVIFLNQHIPTRWKIDPWPISVLGP